MKVGLQTSERHNDSGISPNVKDVICIELSQLEMVSYETIYVKTRKFDLIPEGQKVIAMARIMMHAGEWCNRLCLNLHPNTNLEYP